MEKLRINSDACIGCGMCVSNNPEYIVFNDEGYAEPIDVPVKPEDKKDLLEAVEACPTEAICIEEEK